MKYGISLEGGYVQALFNGLVCDRELSKSEYDSVKAIIQGKPADPDGYAYKLRADNYEWELVENPTEPEPSVDDKAEAYDILMGVSE